MIPTPSTQDDTQTRPGRLSGEVSCAEAIAEGPRSEEDDQWSTHSAARNEELRQLAREVRADQSED